MSVTDLVSIAIGTVGGLVGIASALGSFRAGRSNIQSQVIDAYEKRLTQMDADIQDLKRQLEGVKVQLDIADKDRIMLKDILQGRNPEFEQYMLTSLRLLNDIHSKVMPLSTSLNVTPSPSL